MRKITTITRPYREPSTAGKKPQLDIVHESDKRLIKAIMKPVSTPCFNRALLKDLYAFQYNLKLNHGYFLEHGFPEPQTDPVRFIQFCSSVPGVFSLGGDLSLIRKAIMRKDELWLHSYANLCIENLWVSYMGAESVTTIALVQGIAFGGGFECALSADVIVAEEHSRFSFPEVMFNLFPGMGALSFLARTIGMSAAEKMISNRRVYTAHELHEMGIVDIIAKRDEGQQAVYDWINQVGPNLNAFQGIKRTKKIVNGIKHSELKEVAAMWVRTALNINERNLKMMDVLVKAQHNKIRNLADVVNEINVPKQTAKR